MKHTIDLAFKCQTMDEHTEGTEQVTTITSKYKGNVVSAGTLSGSGAETTEGAMDRDMQIEFPTKSSAKHARRNLSQSGLTFEYLELGRW